MRPTTETAILTVAAVRRPKGTRVTEYLFNEREQIFSAPCGETCAHQGVRHRPHVVQYHFDRILEHLRSAMTRRDLVHVRLTSPHGDVIEDVDVA